MRFTLLRLVGGLAFAAGAVALLFTLLSFGFHPEACESEENCVIAWLLTAGSAGVGLALLVAGWLAWRAPGGRNHGGG